MNYSFAAKHISQLKKTHKLSIQQQTALTFAEDAIAAAQKMEEALTKFTANAKSAKAMANSMKSQELTDMAAIWQARATAYQECAKTLSEALTKRLVEEPHLGKFAKGSVLGSSSEVVYGLLVTIPDPNHIGNDLLGIQTEQMLYPIDPTSLRRSSGVVLHCIADSDIEYSIELYEKDIVSISFKETNKKEEASVLYDKLKNEFYICFQNDSRPSEKLSDFIQRHQYKSFEIKKDTPEISQQTQRSF